MTSAYTPLLGLVLPVTGELSGTWGTVWNDSGTSLIDSAISGTTTLSADADVTLTTTTGAANQARQAIILWTAGGTATRTITVPAQSKIYTVINKTSSTQSIKIVGAGPTTGVTIIAGEATQIAWNGVDFVKVGEYGGDVSFRNVTVTGTTTLSGLTASTALALDASKNVVSVTNTGTGNNVLATSPTLVTPILGTPQSVTLTNATGLPLSTGVTGTLATTNGGTGLTSFTANGVVYASSTSALATGSALTFDGTNLGVGATTPLQLLHLSSASAPGMQITYQGVGASRIGIASGNALTFGLDTSNGATEQMRLTSTGLGIGTSSPIAKLNVYHAANTDPTLTTNAFAPVSLNNAGVELTYGVYTSSPFAAWLQTKAGGASWPLAINPLGGNVGIGTSSPAYKLDVAGTVNVVNGSNGRINIGATNNYLYGDSSGNFIVGTSGSDKLQLTSSGNLGLGVTPKFVNGYTAFEVKDASLASSGSSDLELTANGYYNSGWKYRNTFAATRYEQYNGYHAWFTAPSGTAGNAITFIQAMTLGANGNLLIGSTTAPTGFSRLSLVGGESSGTGANSGVQFTYNSSTYGGGAITTVNAAGGGMSFYTFTGNVGSEAYAERARIDSSGNLLVGTTSRGHNAGLTAFDMDVTDGALYITHATGTPTGYYFASFGYNTTSIGSITQSGTTAVLYNVTSDQRLKENIVDAPEFGSVIDSIKVRSYDWKADGNHQRAGFVAQELVTVAPEAVHQPADPEQMMAVDYSKLVPMLVKEIQSLRTRLAALEAK